MVRKLLDGIPVPRGNPAMDQSGKAKKSQGPVMFDMITKTHFNIVYRQYYVGPINFTLLVRDIEEALGPLPVRLF